ncbi:FkbM family methyltransferase [Rhodoferax sp.]|uniref:FkbM family methyltransferase n=1 Tax=Rhodoferax sp. TaxID=50421 RepID=UPI0025EBBDBC|nr:FkbM family methyltransferase [Rhodoferax sp.]
MTDKSKNLKKALLDLAAQGTDPVDHYRALMAQRPLFVLQPLSGIGRSRCKYLLTLMLGVVALVDDGLTEPEMFGVPCWTTTRFMQQARQHPGALAIDFSDDAWGRGLTAARCLQAGVALVDCIPVLAVYGLFSVYETVNVYRSKTLERLDDFVRLADRLDDSLSRETLYANLLFRLSYDRNWLRSIGTDASDEYFSMAGQPSTFTLGTQEHFCDCGAFEGPVVRKFLAASQWQYGSITAFEPDRTNFAVLSQLSDFPVPDFRPVNKAVSSRCETLYFEETGTMSSHIVDQGSVTVKTVRLDDELERLSFLKMDVEGFEAKTLHGAAGLLAKQRPRIAACVYHYAQDLLDVVEAIDQHAGDYHFRLRQHNVGYYYDLVLYASPIAGCEPLPASA